MGVAGSKLRPQAIQRFNRHEAQAFNPCASNLELALTFGVPLARCVMLRFCDVQPASVACIAWG
jgi:hypothetical protein